MKPLIVFSSHCTVAEILHNKIDVSAIVQQSNIFLIADFNKLIILKKK